MASISQLSETIEALSARLHAAEELAEGLRREVEAGRVAAERQMAAKEEAFIKPNGWSLMR